MLDSKKSITYYEILEVSSNASQAVIRAAYKSLMQHYHPDKNSSNPAMAQQATLIGNAYEILSDLEKRRTYDLELELHSQNSSTFTAKPASVDYGVMTTQQKEQSSLSPEIGSASLKDITETSAINETMAFVIILFILIISLLIASKSYQPSIQADQQQIQEMKAAELSRATAEQEANAEIERKKAESKIARTIPEFAKVIIVKMPPDKDGFNSCNIGSECTHYINIPTLGVIVYEKDSDKIIQHIEKNRDLIVEGIKTELGHHQYTSLTQVDGEETLRSIILRQMNDSIVGSDNLRTGLISEYRGVEEVLLPESFFIH